MKIPTKIRTNLLLKMTSLNAVVIGIRLVLSLVVQRLLAQFVGETGISKIGQLRNLIQIATATSSVGVFKGVVKYIAQYKEDEKQLQKLFSTSFVFIAVGSFITTSVLFFSASFISDYLFATTQYAYLIKLFAVIVPFIGIHSIFYAVINGLSRYKKFAVIDLVGYLLSTALTLYFLFHYNIDMVLIAVMLSPVIQLLVLIFLFFKTLKEYVQFSKLTWRPSFGKNLLSFSLMAFFSTVLLNYVEIGIRSMLVNKISEAEAGIWTAMTNISRNYMVFSASLFSLYVLPKFSGIFSGIEFKKELFSIYKTLLPIFGVGMLLIYFLREYIIQLIYPDFDGLAPLFKWQLMGDFIKLMSVILANQFLAKKMVRSFIFTEIFSLAVFFGAAYYLSNIYGVEGVVMANLIRYVLYFVLVVILVFDYFKNRT